MLERLRCLAVPEPISASDVRHVARLARLDLTDDEVATFTEQLAGMIEHFGDIDALDLDGVEPMTQPFPMSNVLRDDIVGATADRDEVLAAAPRAEHGRFQVPLMLGQER